jgi:hypothetical protein
MAQRIPVDLESVEYILVTDEELGRAIRVLQKECSMTQFIILPPLEADGNLRLQISEGSQHWAPKPLEALERAGVIKRQ